MGGGGSVAVGFGVLVGFWVFVGWVVGVSVSAGSVGVASLPHAVNSKVRITNENNRIDIF